MGVGFAEWHAWSSARDERLAGERLVILSRREGVGLHDEIMAACRAARVVPEVAHTPGVVSTVLSYVEAGAGIGVIFYHDAKYRSFGSFFVHFQSSQLGVIFFLFVIFCYNGIFFENA